MEKACLFCGEMFEPRKNNPHQKFCCARHGQLAICESRKQETRLKRLGKRCVFCGELFEATNANQLYCCERHKRSAEIKVAQERLAQGVVTSTTKKYRHRLLIKNCLTCDTPFATTNSRNAYCCKQHSRQGFNQKRRERRQLKKPVLNCLICEAVIKNESHAGRTKKRNSSRRKYCKKCARYAWRIKNPEASKIIGQRCHLKRSMKIKAIIDAYREKISQVKEENLNT